MVSCEAAFLSPICQISSPRQAGEAPTTPISHMLGHTEYGHSRHSRKFQNFKFSVENLIKIIKDRVLIQL